MRNDTPVCAWNKCPMLAPRKRCCGTSVPYTHSVAVHLSIHAYGADAGDAVSDEAEGGGEVSEEEEEERSEREGSDGKDNEIEEERDNNFFNCLLAKLLSFHEATVRSNKDNNG